MARRRAILHLPLPDGGGDLVEAAIEAHASTLEARGVRRPARGQEEMLRAAVELRRDHRAWGFRRRDVEGSWADLCRRARSGRPRPHTVLFGHPLLTGLTAEQAALLLDGLADFEVHVVLTGPGGTAPDRGIAAGATPAVETVADLWRSALRRPERVHVVAADTSEGGRSVGVWTGFGRAAGLDVSDLSVPHRTLEEPVRRLAARHLASRPQPTGRDPLAAAELALGESLLQLHQLRARQELLEARHAQLARRRRGWKLRIASVAAGS
ncbi:hypothetical protein [Nocardioides ferulae]|uniref:hypothetical protein n=1 Tax=Nocardioides ferulae TaxID=2340821 RepID=UPI000EB4FA2B|nr:hypothetical protein [Nocardioides ferulae]